MYSSVAARATKSRRCAPFGFGAFLPSSETLAESLLLAVIGGLLGAPHLFDFRRRHGLDPWRQLHQVVFDFKPVPG